MWDGWLRGLFINVSTKLTRSYSDPTLRHRLLRGSSALIRGGELISLLYNSSAPSLLTFPAQRTNARPWPGSCRSAARSELPPHHHHRRQNILFFQFIKQSHRIHGAGYHKSKCAKSVLGIVGGEEGGSDQRLDNLILRYKSLEHQQNAFSPPNGSEVISLFHSTGDYLCILIRARVSSCRATDPLVLCTVVHTQLATKLSTTPNQIKKRRTRRGIEVVSL